MPVRSSSSSVLKWPDQGTVVGAVHEWAQRTRRAHRDVVRVGYAGSYARGDWGVGSDVDLILVVRGSAPPFERRGAAYDATDLPVPADLLVYTEAEWHALVNEGRMITRQTVWMD